jgi:hypothetical protein
MKNLILFSTALILVFSLSACGNITPTPSAEVVISGVYASVAKKLTSVVTPVTPRATPTLTATSTLQPSPTLISASPTSQSWNWFWSTLVSSGCSDATFIKDVTIPEETILAPGETFVKIWRFRNTGSCTWTSDFSLVFIKGDDLDGSDTTLDETVPINKKVDVSVSLTAPDDEGTYVSYWKLADENGNTFGDLVYVSIIVEDPTSTPTPTATFTSTDTPTSVPTGTVTSLPSATATATLSNTATSTPTPDLATPTPTFTSSPTATEILPPTSTPTVLPPTPTLTPTLLDTETLIPTDFPTQTPTDIPATTPTEVPTETPTSIPTGTATPTASSPSPVD